MKSATREWVGKAEEDYRTAELIERSRESLYDQLCFHCQQSAEKYLKALLEESGHAIDKTHDLEKLLTCLLPQHPALRSLRRGLVFLTGFAVATRYPGDHATKRQATSARRWAGKVREMCRKLLGLRPLRKVHRKSQ